MIFSMLHSLNIDEEYEGCDSDPCMYGGTCIDTAQGFRCKCRQGFHGKRCDCGELTFDFCSKVIKLMFSKEKKN